MTLLVTEVEIECERCSVGFLAVKGRGRLRRFCDSCRVARDRERQAAYKERHREKVRADGREYAARRRATDPDVRERDRLAAAARRRARPEEVAAGHRSYYERHVSELREKRRKRLLSEEAQERRRAYQRAWCERNRDKAREHCARRRAATLGAPVVDRIDRDEIYARDKGCCHLCGRKAPRDRWDLDHLIPLSLGGEHTAANVAVSHARCNRSRGNRPLPGAVT